MNEPQRGVPRSEWTAVGIFVAVQIFSAGGFVWSVSGKMSDITTELHELNRSVSESQVVTGKLVEHLNSVDRRLDHLESLRH